MLDNQMIEQLKPVLGKLKGNIGLIYAESNHVKQSELLEMLNQVASTSSNILVQASDIKSETPYFEIMHNQIPTGISFSGIPGGHEFTSLVLAILNADHQGKLPDEGFIKRIQSLKGPDRKSVV